MNRDRAASVVRLAVGQAWGRPEAPAPVLSFDLAPELRELDAVALGAEEQAMVAGQVLAAYRWCAARFPLRHPDAAGGEAWAIRHVMVGRSGHPGEYLTASSPHRPCSVLVAAPWPLQSVYRLASLLAHEAIHQALYNRERRGPVARVGSLAYSPWKQQLRPGRLVWHALWTFAGQFVLLGDAVSSEGPSMLAADSGLGDFLGEMAARLAICMQSLREFDILDGAEADRVDRAFALVTQVSSELEGVCPGFVEAKARWLGVASREAADWSTRAFPLSAA